MASRHIRHEKHARHQNQHVTNETENGHMDGTITPAVAWMGPSTLQSHGWDYHPCSCMDGTIMMNPNHPCIHIGPSPLQPVGQAAASPPPHRRRPRRLPKRKRLRKLFGLPTQVSYPPLNSETLGLGRPTPKPSQHGQKAPNPESGTKYKP